MRGEAAGRSANPDAQHQPHFTDEDVEIHRCKGTSGLWSQRALGSRLPSQCSHPASLLKNPKSTSKIEISPHLATLGPGVMALACVPLPPFIHPSPAQDGFPCSSFCASRLPPPLLHHRELHVYSPRPSSSQRYQNGQWWAQEGRQGNRGRSLEAVGLVWGAGEKEDQVGKATAISQDTPCTRPPPPCRSASHLPSPAPWNQTALRKGRQVLSVSNVFHYKCSTIR